MLGILLLAQPATAAPGDVDSSFGENGKVLVSGDNNQQVLSMAVGPDDSIYVLSMFLQQCPLGTCSNLGVRRFSADGALDASYSPAPLTPAPESTAVEGRGGALSVSPDGSVLVAAGGPEGFQVLRLLPGGERDPSFGAAGLVSRSIGAPTSLKAIASRPDGRIVLSGSVLRSLGPSPAKPSLLLAQLRENGEADLGWGSAGVLELDLELSSPGGLSVGPDNTDVGVAGSRGGLRAVRLTDRGSLLDSLAIRPLGVEKAGLPLEVPVLLSRGDGLLAVARTDQGTFVVALDSEGDVDPRFGNHGLTFLRGFSGGSSAAEAPTAVRDGAGRLVLAGALAHTTEFGEGASLMGLVRLRRDGRVDRTFAAGRTQRSSRGEIRNGQGIGLQRDGRIVVVGQTYVFCFRSCAPRRFLLERYLGGTSHARCQGRRATIVGSRKSERIVGTRRADVIASLGGNDSVRGRAGNDLICGGAGEDDLAGGPGRDRVRQ